MYEWADLPWAQLERQVYKLQKRIYHASQRGDVTTVHRLQRLLLRSWAARCLAVRRVTQDNRGKKTAGVDGMKSLSPARRLHLATLLRVRATALPLRRVWIPKPGTTEQRPLGIPTLRDRAAQALVKLALEPQWEALFEPNSYGFRPGRSCQDAIEAIFTDISRQPKYVLDADIAKCFDHINHAALLRQLQTFPHLRRTIKAWLQAGVWDGTELFPTTAGTPQGGVLSPLLANIALHGLETAVHEAIPRWHYTNGRQQRWTPHVVRYADDFVVLHQDRAVIDRCREVVAGWLAERGLELKPSKTRLAHTLEAVDGRVGFDFLGFQIRQHAVGQAHTARNTNGTPLGCKTIITPSREAQQRHLEAVRAMIRYHQTASQAVVIQRLNPLIRGWTAYYASVCAMAAFRGMDQKTYHRLVRWATRRHPGKGFWWVINRYWHHEQAWTFRVPTGPELRRHSHTAITRHVKVRGTKSVYDGDWVYWSTRLGRHPELPPGVALLLKRQRGQCAWCGLYFRSDDIRERDHILPVIHGGEQGDTNRQLLHGHCHDQKTALDGIQSRARFS